MNEKSVMILSWCLGFRLQRWGTERTTTPSLSWAEIRYAIAGRRAKYLKKQRLENE